MTIDFKHYQSAHCENGVTSSLLKHNGINLSEAMVFGIGAGLLFAYFPFLKVNAAPVVSYRVVPGFIFKRVCKRLGIKIYSKKFRNPADATLALDNILEKKLPVALQVGVFNLTYFPDVFRFHFNAHNIVVFGKEDGKYLISDPVMEQPTSLTIREMEKVRFAKGVFAPKGHLYYAYDFPKEYDLKKAIIKGIKRTSFDMLFSPPLIIGVSAIKNLSVAVKKWHKKLGGKKAAHYLAQVVRMQEEIGTGGAGFRFIYAAFLQEASKILNLPALSSLSLELTAIGDRWREFALMAARNYKERANPGESYLEISDVLFELYQREKSFFRKLRKLILSYAG